ncbi:MAG: GrpB family protein [Planctomycetota bacterium]
MTPPRITVVDYDPAWPRRFDALHATLWPELSAHAFTLEHVGSTSVAELAAKPIIDAAVVVEDSAVLPSVIAVLATHGYVHRGDLGVPGREAFHPPARTFAHHLYACVRDNLGLRNHLALRDALRRDPQKAREYGALKKRLADRFPHDIDAYVAGKTDFILAVLRDTGFAEDELSAIRAVNT